MKFACLVYIDEAKMAALTPAEGQKLTDDTSKLNMHVIYESAALRDQMLQLPFAQGINMAHNRIQDILGNPDSYRKK